VQFSEDNVSETPFVVETDRTVVGIELSMSGVEDSRTYFVEQFYARLGNGDPTVTVIESVNCYEYYLERNPTVSKYFKAGNKSDWRCPNVDSFNLRDALHHEDQQMLGIRVLTCANAYEGQAQAANCVDPDTDDFKLQSQRLLAKLIVADSIYNAALA